MKTDRRAFLGCLLGIAASAAIPTPIGPPSRLSYDLKSAELAFGGDVFTLADCLAATEKLRRANVPPADDDFYYLHRHLSPAAIAFLWTPVQQRIEAHRRRRRRARRPYGRRTGSKAR